MDATKKSIRQLISELCDAEGSQSKFARRIGATPQKVNNWVNGRNEPGTDALLSISKVYEIPFDSLVTDNTGQITYEIVSLNDLGDPKQQAADEMGRYMQRMTDKQRRAVLGVARAMVDC